MQPKRELIPAACEWIREVHPLRAGIRCMFFVTKTRAQEATCPSE